jgi:hypothetical protein
MKNSLPQSLWFLVVLCLVFAFSCKTKNGINDLEDEPQGPVSFEIISYTDSIGDCRNAEIPCAEISFSFPQFTAAPNQQVLDSLNKHVVSLMLLLQGDEEAEPIRPFMKKFLDEFNEFMETQPSYKVSWALERNVDVLYIGDSILSLSFYEYAYLGGAHPNSATIYKNINLNTGAVLSLYDIFNPAFTEQLNELGEGYFRVSRRIPYEADLNDEGFWFENGFYLPDNFGFSQSEIIFIFNPYEIGPYVMGASEFHIPLDAALPYLRANTILSP